MSLSPEVLRAVEIAATLFGAAYVILAARRNRLCWIAGAVSSVLVGFLSVVRELPMQGALNAYYVGMSAYGWRNWSRMSGEDELPVRTLAVKWHLLAAVILAPLSWLTAELLARETQAAWPLLDSLATWFALFATWLVARARIENWIYWIVIDGVLVYLYFMQGLPVVALQFAVFMGLAMAGWVAWRRRLVAQAVPR